MATMALMSWSMVTKKTMATAAIGMTTMRVTKMTKMIRMVTKTMIATTVIGMTLKVRVMKSTKMTTAFKATATSIRVTQWGLVGEGERGQSTRLIFPPLRRKKIKVGLE